MSEETVAQKITYLQRYLSQACVRYRIDLM
jgi:hypothetical protein